MTQSKKLFLCVTILVSLLVTGSAYGATRIVIAKWHADKQTLSVMGVTHVRNGATISIANAETGETLGYVSTDHSGVWKFKVRPKVVPLRVIAFSNGDMSAIKPVNITPQSFNQRK